jgi:hypothetical protein
MESAEDFVKAWDKAGKVAKAFGDSSGPLAPHPDEKLLPYRQRLASQYSRFSPTFKSANLTGLNCPIALSAVEDQIYADALTAANSGSTVPSGQMRAVVRNDGAGRPITTYVGSDPGACWDKFAPPVRYVTRIGR